MKQSDLNHLRRLLGWIRCDIGQSPAELQQTMIEVADGLGHPEISPEAKARMVETYRHAESIPLYVRAAVKALEKTLAAGGRDRGADTARSTARSVNDLPVIPYPLSHTDAAGRIWYPYEVQFTSPDGVYACHIYAISDDHARLQLDALKESGHLAGRTIGASDA